MMFGSRYGVVGSHGGRWSIAQWEKVLGDEAEIVSATTTEIPIRHSGPVTRAEGNFEFTAPEICGPTQRGGFRKGKALFGNIPTTDVNGLILVQFEKWIHTYALSRNLAAIGLRRGTHHELLVVAKLLPDLQKEHPILQHGNVEGIYGTALDFEENQRGLTLAYYYAPTVLRHEPSSAFAYITTEQRVLAARIVN